MIGNLFSVRYVSVQTDDWDSKKAKLKALLRESDFERRDLAQFETDRHLNGNRYVKDFCQIFNTELNRFGMEMGLTELEVISTWAVRYGRDDYHSVHNHRSTGYSGILYVDFDEEEHTPSVHISPWNNPVSDMTDYSVPRAIEGTMIFVPSNVLHFTRPNQSDKIRSIVAFDMEIR